MGLESLLLQIILGHIGRRDGKIVQWSLAFAERDKLDDSKLLNFLVHGNVEEVSGVICNAKANRCGFRLRRWTNNEFEFGLKNSKLP